MVGRDKPPDPHETLSYSGLPPTAGGSLSSGPETGSAPTSGVLGLDLGESLRSSGYEVLRELGRGGMGVVYLAINVALKRPCAIKMFSAATGGATAAARLRAEAEIVARVRHPNIVQIHRVGEAGGFPFLELEYLPGGSLADHLGGGPRPAAEAARLIEAMARAVAEAHRLGIVHRDLKPANVLLADDDEPKVGDFGLARSLASDVRLTHTGQLVGTPCYMAPEQAEAGAGDAGPEADVYSLGAILYELLTGYPPFRAATPLQTLELARSREPVPPRHSQPAVPRDLETICLKCLQKDPSRRYPEAGALADDLGRFLDRRPILARPIGAVEHAWKWARRHPAVAALSAALMATAALALALVAWQWRRAEDKAAAEVAAHAEASLAHREAVRGQAELAMEHGRALCEQGEIGRGMLWLARTLRLADEALDGPLDRAARVNLADWSARLARPLAQLQIPSPARDLAFRPDGRGLVALGDDGALHCWDADSWRESESPLSDDAREGGDRLVGPVAFDPSGGGTMVAFDRAGRAIFWDAGCHRRTGPALTPPEPAVVRGVAFVGGRRRLVTYDADGRLRWWDTATGGRACGPPRSCRGVTALAASPDGSTLATGGDDGRVVLRDLASWQPLGPALPHGSPVRALAFLGGGRRLLVATSDGRVQVWDSDAPRVSVLPPEGLAVTSLAVSADGGRFATGTEGGTVRLWDSTTLRQIGQTFKLAEAVRSLALRPDGRALAVGLEDGTIRVWEMPRPGPIATPLPAHGPVRAVAFSPDRTHLMAVGSRGPEWWDIGRRGDLARPVPVGGPRGDSRPPDRPDTPFAATAVSPDGRRVATTVPAAPGDSGGPRVALLDTETGALVGEGPAGPDPPAGFAFSPDSRRLLAWGDRPGTATLREVDAMGRARPLLRSLAVAIHHASFSPDGRTLLLGCRDGKARLWDVGRDAEVDSAVRPHHAYPITAVAFEPRGPRIVTGCHAGTVRLWDRASGALLNDARGNAGEITAFAFSPDGSTLVTASLDSTARFWDVASGRQLGPPLHHADAVLCVAFHPDGRVVAAGTRDGSTWLWPVPPPPIQGDPRRLDRIVEERTGLRLTHR